MAAALVLGVAGAEVAAVVRGVDHDGLLQLTRLLQGLQQPAHVLVQAGHAAVVPGQLGLPVARQGAQVRGHEGVGVARLVPLRGHVAVDVVLVVGLQEGDHLHERGRPARPGELAQGGDGAVGGGVHAVAGGPHLGPGAVVEDGLEGPRDQLRDVRGLPEVGEAPPRLRGHRTVAVLPPRQVPLAHVAGLVALPGQAGGQRRRIRGEAEPVAPDAVAGGVLPAEETGPGGGADRLVGDGEQEARPLPRQAVEVRGEAHGAAVHPQGVPALLVGEDDQDIGPGVSCSRHSSGW